MQFDGNKNIARRHELHTLQRMSAFATQLLAVLHTHYGGNQARFANEAGVNSGTVSRLVREEVVPSADTLQLLASNLSRTVAASLIGAFLRDLIPQPLRGEIGVWLACDSQDGRLKQRTPSSYQQLDPETRAAFDLLTALALDNGDVRDAITYTAKFLGDTSIATTLETARAHGAAETLSSMSIDPASAKADTIVRRRLARQKSSTES